MNVLPCGYAFYGEAYDVLTCCLIQHAFGGVWNELIRLYVCGNSLKIVQILSDGQVFQSSPGESVFLKQVLLLPS